MIRKNGQSRRGWFETAGVNTGSVRPAAGCALERTRTLPPSVRIGAHEYAPYFHGYSASISEPA
jgi:hypothetical protein